MPYRIASPPPDPAAEGDHPYVAVLAAARRRTRIGAFVVISALLALPFLLPRRTVEHDARAHFEKLDGQAHGAVEAARLRIAMEQEGFDRAVRRAALGDDPDRMPEIACDLRLEGEEPRFGARFPVLVVDRKEISEKLPSQSLAMMLSDAEHAEHLSMVSRPAESIDWSNRLLGPGRLRQEIVLVTTTHVPAKAKSGGAYEPGRIAGTAYLYDFVTRKVICSGAVEATSSRSIGYAYATGADALPSAGIEASMNATLEADLRKNVEHAIASHLHAF